MCTIDFVRQFHLAFNHPVAISPEKISRELRELRIRLIVEELIELCNALGVDIDIKAGPWYMGRDQAKASVVCLLDRIDLVETADAIADLDYVIQGLNLVMGLPGKEIIREVHRSNMSKLGPDGKPIYRDDGKILKGPFYSPPNIKRIIDAHTPVSL